MIWIKWRTYLILASRISFVGNKERGNQAPIYVKGELGEIETDVMPECRAKEILEQIAETIRQGGNFFEIVAP